MIFDMLVLTLDDGIETLKVADEFVPDCGLYSLKTDATSIFSSLEKKKTGWQFPEFDIFCYIWKEEYIWEGARY